MRTRWWKALGVLGIAAASGSAWAGPQGTPAPAIAESEQAQLKAMIDRTVAFLRSQQDPASGGWAVNPKGPSYPAITGLVLAGLMGDGSAGENDPTVQLGHKYLLNAVQPDGGIYDQVLPSYNTAIAVSALSRFSDPRSKEAVKNAVAFLRKIQYGEEAAAMEGLGESAKPVGREDPFYGGWGYGRHGRPDLSNTAFALEALHASGVEASDPAFQRALVFLQRCQMVEKVGEAKVNDQAYAAGSTQGGFIYATSVNKERVGVGQSQAGEVAESLSGPPGTVAHVQLRTNPDGKELTLTRDDVRRMLAETAEGSSRPAIRSLATEAVIVLGPTSDGQSASTFEIRTPITSTEALQDFLFAALAGEVKDRGAIRVEAADHWKGISRLRAYGSMTYSGFKSYAYANLRKDDPRVRAAWGWIQANYTLAENPGMGTDGYYYYLLAFSRALKASGEDLVPMPAGATGEGRAWRHDLVKRLAELQEPDGSFRTVDNRWLEDNKVLISAYALIAMREASR